MTRMKREEQDRLARTILTILCKGNVCRTDLLRLTIKRNSGATLSRFNAVLMYLHRKGFVDKLGPPRSRAPYKITEKGKRFLEIME